MSDRDDTRDTRDNTRECGSMFDPRAERADTHTRGAPTGPWNFTVWVVTRRWGYSYVIMT